MPAGGGADVVGVDEIAQGGQLQVDSFSQRAFQHSPDPGRDAVVPGQVVNIDGGLQAADPSGFDVHVTAGFQFDGQAHVPDALDGFVEADRGVELLLELGVLQQVVMEKGLFDHGQAQLVHFLEHGQVVEGEARVAVDVKGVFGKVGADGFEHLQPPAPGEFQFGAFVPGVDPFLDRLHEHVQVFLDAVGDAGVHDQTGPAEKLVKRKPVHDWP